MKPEEIKAIRKGLGLTQVEFAARLKIDPQTISCFERGLHRPHRLTLKKLLRAKRDLEKIKAKKEKEIE